MVKNMIDILAMGGMLPGTGKAMDEEMGCLNL